MRTQVLNHNIHPALDVVNHQGDPVPACTHQQEGRFFAFLNPVRNPLPILVIAYSVRRLPYVVRSAVAGLQQTSVTLEEAAPVTGGLRFALAAPAGGPVRKSKTGGFRPPKPGEKAGFRPKKR